MIKDIEINGESVPVKTVKWQIGEETQLEDLFRSVDILILNHGVGRHRGSMQRLVSSGGICL